MSSEEESEKDDGSRVFLVRPLPWRSEKVNQSFAALDEHHKTRQNKRSKHQTTPRAEGRDSTRQAPPNTPPFALKDSTDAE